jgi:hypothetical protein
MTLRFLQRIAATLVAGALATLAHAERFAQRVCRVTRQTP